jgi:predicted RNA-binding Zn-ribbon protein involved in translation (DUF1610 family)
MDIALKQRIGRAIQERDVGPCPSCGGTDIAIADHFARILVSETPDGKLNVVAGVPNMSMAILGCPHCGDTRFFHLGVLGITG